METGNYVQNLLLVKKQGHYFPGLPQQIYAMRWLKRTDILFFHSSEGLQNQHVVRPGSLTTLGNSSLPRLLR